MAIFNICVGIIVGIILILPLIVVKQRWARLLIAAIALIVAVFSVQFSEIYLYPRYLAFDFEHEILKEPLFRVIKSAHPKEFAEFIDKVKQNIVQKKDPNIIPLYSAELVNNVFYEHLKNAPDANVALYLKATIDLYRYLYSQDPRAVVKLENSAGNFQYNFDAFIGDKQFSTLLSHLLDTKRLLIEAAIKAPVAAPTQEQAAPLLQTVLKNLAAKYGDNVVQIMFAPPQPNTQANAIANMFIDFYSGILDSGKENAGIIMRHIGNLKSKEIETNKAPEQF